MTTELVTIDLARLRHVFAVVVESHYGFAPKPATVDVFIWLVESQANVKARDVTGAERERLFQERLDTIDDRVARGEQVTTDELVSAMKDLTNAIGPIRDTR